MGLESVELVMEWEREFTIKIPNHMAATLETPELAANAIEDILASEGRSMDRASIERIIRKTTLDISGMEPGDYRPEGKFVQDFGLD